MLKNILFVLIFMAGYLTLNASLYDSVKKGLDLTYSFKFEEAKLEFQKVILEYPSNPEGYHFLSQIHIWAFLGSREEVYLDSFWVNSDKALELAEIIENDSTSNWNNFILGNIFTLRATALTSTGSTMDAFWASKSAVSFYEDTIDEDPNYYDSYLGLGLFNYALSFVPGVFKWAISISGLSSDKEEGLVQIKQAYNLGDYSKTEAAYHLSKVYIEYTADYDSAEIILKNLLKIYPNNTLFQYQYAILMIDSRNLNEAIVWLDRIVKDDNKYFSQTTSFSQFLLGQIYFKLNKFEKAITHYNLFTTSTKSIDYLGITNYQTGLCYELLGDSLQAKRNYLMGNLGNHDIADDLFARNESEKKFESFLSEIEKETLYAANLIEQSEYDKAKLKFEHLLTQKISVQDSAEIFIHLAEVELNLKDYEKSIEYSLLADSLELTKDLWLMSLNYIILSEAYFHVKEYSLSEDYLSEIIYDDDYGLYNKFERRVNRIEKLHSTIKN